MKVEKIHKYVTDHELKQALGVHLGGLLAGVEFWRVSHAPGPPPTAAQRR